MTNLDIIVLLVVVALIFQRLWRALGTRPEEEPRKIRMSRESAEKLCNILRAEAERNLKKQEKAEQQEITPLETEPLTETEAALRQIPNFRKEVFISGAKKAFQVITEAFNKADSEALKMLVSNTIYKKLQEVIRQRQADEMTAETEFICFDKAEIIHAKIAGKNKAEAIKHGIEGSVSHMWPISILQMHQHGIIVCDEEAVSLLQPETVNYFKEIENRTL